MTSTEMEEFEKGRLVDRIVEIEWQMFRDVPNFGGPALCQQDKTTFEIMRHAQVQSWSIRTLKSYLCDLEQAKNDNRNLQTEKYARMMQFTLPSEYEHVKHMLPVLGSDVVALIEAIMAIIIEWETELSKKFPFILRRGRPIYSDDDTEYITSIETYLKGELATYSKKTLELYYEGLLKQVDDKVNGSEITLGYIIKKYGFGSLEQANNKLKMSVKRSN